MGKGLAYQAAITPGITCVALADLDVGRAAACATFLQHPFCEVHSASDAAAAIGDSKLAITGDGQVVAECEGIDVLIESSGELAGGHYAEQAIRHGTHVVMMNAEADLMFGPYLMTLAAAHGVVYTSTDGDQHGVITHMVDELRSWGFELVMAGNIKGFLDRYANPTTIIPEASKRNFDAKKTAGYTDGSKLCIEMALLANGLGLSTPSVGMTGPRLDHVRQVLDVFDFPAIRRGGAVVDYILGAEPDGGVFAVGYCDNAYQRGMLATLKMGAGPFYLFYRPYHLCYVEAMDTVKQAAAGRTLLQPAHGFRTNVFAYAKRDLRAGDRLDGVGGYTCYGLIENCTTADVAPGLPLCLADDVVLTRDVRRDERLRWDDIAHAASAPAFELFARAVEASRSLTGSPLVAS
jgi:predicted homoserine dehydrogenase-like protein